MCIWCNARTGTYYTGSTNNVERRLKLHNSGDGAKYLRGRGPAKLVYVKKYKSKGQALRAEAKIKTLPRIRKYEMITIYQFRNGYSNGAPPTVLTEQKKAVPSKLSVGVTSKSLEKYV